VRIAGLLWSALRLERGSVVLLTGTDKPSAEAFLHAAFDDADGDISAVQLTERTMRDPHLSRDGLCAKAGARRGELVVVWAPHAADRLHALSDAWVHAGGGAWAVHRRVGEPPPR
jgi:hypothetical protein